MFRRPIVEQRRTKATSATRIIALLLACSWFCGSAVAKVQAIDSSLVDALLEADTTSTQRSAIESIQVQLGARALHPEQVQKIAAGIASGSNLTYSQSANHLVSIPLSFLYQQQSLGQFDHRTTTLLTECLANRIHFSYGDAKSLGKMLGRQIEAGVFPSEASTTLRAALEHADAANQQGAIVAIAATPATSSAWTQATEDLANVLAKSDSYHTRLAAVQGLQQLGSERHLEGAAHRALKSVANGDPTMPVRLQALEAILFQTSGPERNKSEIASLVRELENPTAKLWASSNAAMEYQNLNARALKVLDSWYAPDFPDQVINIFVDACNAFVPQECIDVLRKLRQRDKLSDKHLFELRQIAAEHKNNNYQDQIYQLGLPNLTEGSLVDARRSLAVSGKVETRLAAAHQLLRRYKEQPTPAEITKLAAEILLESKDVRLREAMLRLVANSAAPLPEREEMLLAALQFYSNDREFSNILLALYSPDQLDQFAERHVTDPSLPFGFRATVVRQLATNSTRSIPEGLRLALLQASEGEWTRYQLVNSTISTLEARGAPVPLSLKVKSKQFQSTTLVVLWLFCLVSVVVLSVATSIGIFKLRLRPPGSTQGVKAKRSALVIVWVIATIAMLGFLTLAFVGFLGHNSAPAPKTTFYYNWPLYCAFALYAVAALSILLSARRASKANR